MDDYVNNSVSVFSVLFSLHQGNKKKYLTIFCLIFLGFLLLYRVYLSSLTLFLITGHNSLHCCYELIHISVCHQKFSFISRFGKKSRPAMYDATPIAYEDYSPDDKPLVTLIKTKDL